MKTIGLIGGVTWRSTIEYYRLINEMVESRLGSPHSARIILHSVEFGDLLELQKQGKMPEIYAMLADAAVGLEKAGADMILICANTMHKSAETVQAAITIPLVHIADETAAVIQNADLKKVGLLGTKITMEEDFYKGRLKEKFGIDVVVPESRDREFVSDVIYNELGAGVIGDNSRQRYIEIINSLIENGAEGIVLGCTEIPLLIKQEHCRVPIFDTTLIHSQAAVNRALI
jgi:aspartate racemase